MPFAGYLVYLGHFNLLLGRDGRSGGLQSGLGGGVLDRRQGRAAAGGALRQMGADEPPRSGPDDGLLCEVWRRSRCLLGRLLPVVRTFIAFPAGIAKMPQLRFHIYTFVGSWPWCFALAYAGMKLGERWHTDPRFRAGISPLSPGGGDGAGGGDRLVCVVASEARSTSGSGVSVCARRLRHVSRFTLVHSQK